MPYISFISRGRRGYAQPYLIGVPCVAAAAVLALQSAELYKISALRRFPADSFRLAGALTFVFAATLVLIFFLKLDEVFSRVFMLAWYGSSLVALCGERAALALLVDRLIQTGRLARRTVLVGGGTAADALLNQLAAQPQPDLQILGIFDDRTDERSPAVVAGFPKLGTVDDLLAFSRRTRIDLIIFTLPITAEQRILQMLRKLWVLPIDIRLAAHMNKLHFRPAFLFLHRQRPADRYIRQADRRLGRHHQIRLRQNRRRPLPHPPGASDGARRAGGET